MTSRSKREIEGHSVAGHHGLVRVETPHLLSSDLQAPLIALPEPMNADAKEFAKAGSVKLIKPRRTLFVEAFSCASFGV